MADDPVEKTVDGSEKARHLADANGEHGLPEPKSREDWAKRGAVGGEPGRSPPTPGGSSQGSGDRKSSDDPGGSIKIDRPTGEHPQPKSGEG